MKVVILAGGFGTRYLELTKKIPKPLISVGKKPIIYQLIKHFAHFNHTDFIICCGYKYNLIFEFFLREFKRKKNFIFKKNKNKVEISFQYEHKNWNFLLINTGLNTQTGGRINKIRKFILEATSDDFFLTYADGLSSINLNKLYQFHKQAKSQCTVSIVKIKNQYGIIETKNNKVLSFNEKPNNPYFLMEVFSF